MKLLIVDDDEICLFLLGRALISSGVSVEQAKNTSEAINLLKTHADIGALITDINLNDTMNGFALAFEARRINPAVKIIYMSGIDQSNDPDMVIQGPVLLKPVEADELLDALQTGTG